MTVFSTRSHHLIVLEGQGTAAASSPQTLALALHDAHTPVGSALLVACFEAFWQEHAALSDDNKSLIGVSLSAADAPNTFLSHVISSRPNAVTANISLYLIQLLRYAANLTPSSFVANADATHDHAFLGFSTGMLAAFVIASTYSMPSLLYNAAQGLRLAFWLGFRAQQFAEDTLAGSDAHPSAPWSLVVFGSSKVELQAAVDRFNVNHPARPKLYVTAITHSTCISVSGHPDALKVFQEYCLPHSTSISRYAPIHTLYHSPDLAHVKTQVMQDIQQRNIQFPSYTSLRRPVCSPISGAWISSSSSSTLAEDVVDMTILHPVNFDSVIDRVAHDFITDPVASIRLINVGPGNALSRAIARSLPTKVDFVDWSSAAAPDFPSVTPPRPGGQTREPIAIVGMAVKFPGAKDASGLWEVLEKGLNTVSEIPESRFNVSEYLSRAGASKRSMKTRFGNFMEDADAFDNAFFHISPREARSMDPQQRLLLQVTYHALENAGYVPGATDTFNPDTFATYVGVSTNDYLQNLRNDVDVYYSTGTLQAFLSGKISYAFNFSGPSVVIDTACSSSMVAIYQACRALNNGDCNAAVAGGVNVITSPDMYIGLDRAHFLSSTGQCKPWDVSADGYSRAEGCGMFVLKRLSDAVAENDNILGVIRGIEINQSANAESITHPHIPSQVSLFEKLVSSTGINPADISVIEAHGTGTKAGDPTEIESLRTVFAQNRTADNALHITSVKANIGHAEAASGAASLAKLLLMLKHRAIPAVISLKQLNPRIPDLSLDGTRIDTEFTEWGVTPGGPSQRLALLNNFGAAGSNSALILEEPASTSAPAAHAANAFVVGISAESEDALEKLRSSFLQHIDGGGDDPAFLSNLSYTATARRQLHSYRLSASGQSKADLCRGLRSAQVVCVNEARGKTVFVFSGQGGQYIGMGARLYRTVPAFRRVVDECNAKLVSWGFSGVLHVISSRDSSDQDADVQAFQSAVFVLEYALWSLWTSWGVTADAVAGHSLGEYAALVAAQVLSLDAALRLVAGRARLMAHKCVARQSGMLAVKTPSSAISQLITSRHEFDRLTIACYNSSVDCVVAGDLQQLDILQTELKAMGTKCALVNVPFAYHTSAMAPIFDDIADLARTIPLSAPAIPILSNVHGNVVSAGDSSVFKPDYFARHCRDSVRFEQSVQELMSLADFTEVTTWIEMGPHPTTLPMLRSMPSTSQQALYLPSLRKNAEDWQTLSASLANLYCVRTAIHWRRVLADMCPGAGLTDLPAYPFAQTKYWVAFEEDTPKKDVPNDSVVPAPPKFSLIDSCVSMPPAGSLDPAVFQTSIATVAHLIEGHKVSGFGLCPASVYVEMASAAAKLVFDHRGTASAGSLIKLGDLTFSNPLVHSPDIHRTIRIEITCSAASDPHSGSFEISSYPADLSGKSQIHCRGAFTQGPAALCSSKLALSTTMLHQRKKCVLNNPESEIFHTRTAYNVIFSRIVAYSPLYHTMKTITIDSDGNDAYAAVQLPAEAVPGDYVVNPIFMDTLLHAAGFLINLNAGSHEAFICAQVDKINVVPELITSQATYGVYCNIGMLSDTMAVADAYAVDLDQGTVVAHMKRLHFRRLRAAGFKSLLSSVVSHSAIVPSASGVVTPSSVESGATLLENDTPAGLPDPSTLMMKLKETMGSVLDMSPDVLCEDQELERLGLDSLMSIEAHQALCSSLNVSLPDSLFVTAKSIRDLFDAVSQCTASQVLRTEIKATLFPKPAARQPSTPIFSPSDPVTTSSPPSVAAASTIKTVMASVLDLPIRELRDDVDLERFGLDSLMSIEAHHALCTALHMDLPADILLTCKTIRALQATLIPPLPASQLATNSIETFGTEINPLLIQHDDGCTGAPLFLIHDGGGLATQYKKLGPLGCPVYGIHNPKFTGGGRWEGGIVEMATHYVGLIQHKLHGRTRCLLGGWSVGGVLAYEISRQLASTGTAVSGLLLIDSPCPQTFSILPDSIIDSVFSAKGRGPNKLRDLAKDNIRSLTRSLVAYDYATSPANDVPGPPAVLLACSEGVRIGKSECPSAEWLADRRDLSQMVTEWEQVLQAKVPVLSIPGSHFNIFDSSNVDQVTRKLREAITMLA